MTLSARLIAWLFCLQTPLLSVALLSVPTLKSLTHSPRQQQELGHQRRSTILHSTSSTTRPERNNEETSRRLQYNSLDKAAVTIIEPQTNVQVILLGCFHGSQSSARDVQALLVPPRSDEKHTLPTKAVVLELCASRFLSLRKGMEQEEDATPRTSDEDFDEALQQQEEQPWMTRYVRMVSRVSKSQGISTGIASALLGLASGWQTAMAGLEPGLEFKTALLHNPEDSDVILADQSVDETLYKLGNLPATFLELWRAFLSKGWDDSFEVEADALTNAVFGSSSPTDQHQQQLSVPDFMTRNSAAVKDMLRLILLPLVGLETLNLILSTLSDHLARTTTLDASSFDGTTIDGPHLLVNLSLNMCFLLACYMGVALPAARVVLRERDERLAQGIRAACRIVAKNEDSDKAEPKGRVVAVLGLLHVNGVARRLRAAGNEERPA